VHANNHLGSLAENIVSLLLQRKLNGCYRFSVRFLGAKAELLDFLVELLDDDGKAYGPHFYLQVKTTASASIASQLVHARFSPDEVKRAQGRRVPVYLVAVECRHDDKEKTYIRAVDASLSAGVPGVHRRHSLKDRETRMQLYKEVDVYFNSLPLSFKSALT
jgi:hypothetical protein